VRCQSTHAQRNPTQNAFRSSRQEIDPTRRLAVLAADDALVAVLAAVVALALQTTHSIHTPMGDNELGLPAWLNNLLQPGVGRGAFLTLKLSLIGTVLTALSMLYVVTDEQIRFHLYVFTSLAVVLTGLVFWFIAEAGDAIFQPEAPKKKD